MLPGSTSMMTQWCHTDWDSGGGRVKSIGQPKGSLRRWPGGGRWHDEQQRWCGGAGEAAPAALGAGAAGGRAVLLAGGRVRRQLVEAALLGLAGGGGGGGRWMSPTAPASSGPRTISSASSGAIETWVNAAGISKIVPFLDCTEQTWDQVLDGEPQGRFPRLPGGHPADAAAQPRRHRQPLLAVRQGGQHALCRVLRQQVRRHRPDAVARRRVRSARHPRQRALPGRRADADVGRARRPITPASAT